MPPAYSYSRPTQKCNILFKHVIKNIYVSFADINLRGCPLNNNWLSVMTFNVDSIIEIHNDLLNRLYYILVSKYVALRLIKYCNSRTTIKIKYILPSGYIYYNNTGDLQEYIPSKDYNENLSLAMMILKSTTVNDINMFNSLDNLIGIDDLILNKLKNKHSILSYLIGKFNKKELLYCLIVLKICVSNMPPVSETMYNFDNINDFFTEICHILNTSTSPPEYKEIICQAHNHIDNIKLLYTIIVHKDTTAPIVQKLHSKKFVILRLWEIVKHIKNTTLELYDKI